MKIRHSAAIALAAFIGIMILSGPVLGDAASSDRQLLAAAGDTATFEGELAIKEGHGDILVRADNGDQMRLKVTDATVIKRNGKPAAYTDLQSGDMLKIKYSNQDGHVIELDASGSS